MRTLPLFPCVAAVVAAVAVVAGCGERPAEAVAIYHTGDSYGYFDTCGCRSDSTGGLAKRAWVIDSMRREEDTPFLLVDAGNFSGGGNAYGAALGRTTIEAMELMGYDALTLGDWDLNHGPGYLRDVLADSPIQWIHTNYDVVGLEELGHETLIVERGGRRIGLLGLFNPTILLDGPIRDSVRVEEDLVGVTAAAVADLRAQGVDAVVALSHLSHKANRALADHVQGIDLIVSGHGGVSLVEPERVTPETWLAAAGDLGRFLGETVLRFEGDGERARVAGIEGDLIVMEPSLPNDPRLEPLFARYDAWVRDQGRTELEARSLAPIGEVEAAEGAAERPATP